MSPADTILSTTLELALRSLASIAAQGGDIGNGLTLWSSSSPWAEAAFRAVGKERGVIMRERNCGDGLDLMDRESFVSFATLYLKDER